MRRTGARRSRRRRSRDFVKHLAEHGYVGANITIPHKEAALAMSEPDDRARAVGAANTLWYDGGRLLSTNTDVEGFTANLDAAVPGWEQRRRRRGRAGRRRLGARRHLRADRARHWQKSTWSIARRSGPRRCRRASAPRCSPPTGAALPHLLARAGLLVNTTSLGMTGQPPLAIDLGPLPRHAVVADLVYAPLETPLLAAARARGLPPPMGSACCCTRRCAASSSGSACARR